MGLVSVDGQKRVYWLIHTEVVNRDCSTGGDKRKCTKAGGESEGFESSEDPANDSNFG